MRKLVLGMFVSLDGFVSGPGGEADWIFKSGDDATDEWIVDHLWQAGLIAMGSRSYRDMATFWPSSDLPFAAPMNAIPKVVFTRKGLAGAPGGQATTARTDAERAQRESEPAAPVQGSWANPMVASGDLSDEVARLKTQPGKDIRALGGASFAQALAASGLIDEYHLLVCPVALGQGVSLFSGLSKPVDFQLVGTRTFGGGAISLVYRPA
ncbi:dihydrofolate reductase (plasmid) [Deinococcus aetherius]|uniref:Dihydrofolate reductase n=1 Tax=Deinococcus aetherius TaxID=200252 RepID=A0ABM8AJM3_9DEIO|nr:dihydrofolate reductase family protein [Deinococcus aetherius]BDP43900.1 dihydrofolate reductase [Deinococcus aetherius]